MPNHRSLLLTPTLSALFAIAACGDSTTPTPSAPTPPSPTVTANAYILPGAVSQNDWAFGDEPVVVYKGERVWRRLAERVGVFPDDPRNSSKDES